jgi:VCBS repeat protein/PASTA domain-containing protein
MARGSRRRRRSARACLPGALLATAMILPLSGAVAAVARATVYPTFSPALGLRTDLAPAALEIADVNGDQRPDLVTANRLGDDVSVFLNAGSGSFPRRDYVTSARPTSLAVADLDSDDKPELVTGSEGDGAGGMVSVLVNPGDGSFEAKRDYPTVASPSSVAIGDVDDDRAPDLVVATVDADVSGAGAIAVLGNDGDGAFVARHVYPLGADPASVAIGDLNGDGSADLATANTYAGTVSVLLNDGDGRFPVRRDYATGDWAPSVAIGDLNADGKADLVAGHFDRFVSVFFNHGDGTFDLPREHQTGRYSNDVAIGDVNGDGAPDLATANYQSNTVSILANWGDGSFVARRDYGTAVDPWSVAIGDLNGDGKPEVAAASEDADEISVLANTTGLCTVPGVHKKTVVAAKRAIKYGLCRFGGLRRAYSTAVPKGRVLSATPRAGTVLPTGSTVRLLVSRGRRR